MQASGLLSVSVAPIEPTRSRLRWRLVTRLLGMGLVRMDFFDSAMLFRIEDTISSSARDYVGRTSALTSAHAMGRPVDHSN